MLSRASDARLRKSKSSASVKPRRPPRAPKPFDPEIGHLHALTAASLAMQRHSQGSSTESGPMSDQSYSSDSRVPSRLRRGPSIRYSEDTSSIASDATCHAGSPISVRALLTRNSSLEPVPELSAEGGEFGLFEDGIPSVPSSFRKLRKSKSMFSSAHHDLQTSLRNGTPAASGVGFSRTSLRRSLSFFRGRGDSQTRQAHTEGSDAAVKLAREQFLKEQQALVASEVTPSSRRPQRERPFRKSFRSTNTTDSIASETPTGRYQGSKSRLLSLTIKNGFRRLFGRSSRTDQSHQRQGSHFQGLSSASDGSNSSSATVIDTRGAEPVPSGQSKHGDEGFQRRHRAYRPESVRTMKSSDTMATSSSRVSSWADSIATTTTRHGGTDHRQLAVIRENSGSQSGRSSTASYHDGYSVFRQPLRSANPGTDRLYSALVKKIGKPEEPESSLSLTPQQVAQRNESIRDSGDDQSSCTPRPKANRARPESSTGYTANSEDDSNTVIAAHSARSIAVPQSPSVYSRTTSANSPYMEDLSDSDDDEPGTVTILASHRLPYSPRRDGGRQDRERPIKASSDWRTWMSSQMDVIGTSHVATHFPNMHYREDTQIDDDDGFHLEKCVGGQPEHSPPASQPVSNQGQDDAEGNRPPLAELTPLYQSNFSRPLPRTPSLGNAASYKPSTLSAAHTPPIPPLRTTIRPLSCSPRASPPSRSLSKTPNASPLTYYRRRQSESPRQLATPTRDMQHSQDTTVLRSRYGPGMAFVQNLGDSKRQDQPLPRTPPWNGGLTKENMRVHDAEDPYRGEPENHLAKENMHSAMGSKQMVDIFLSERRQMMGSPDDDNLSEPAFL